MEAQSKAQNGAVRRILSVVQALAETRKFTPIDIAQATHLPTSTAYRMVHALAGSHFAESVSGTRYRVGRQLYRYASLVVDKLDYAGVAQPSLIRLNQEFDVTAAFAMLLPGEAHYSIIGSETSPHGLQYVVQRFAKRSLVGGMLGHAILPFLAEDEVQAAIAAQDCRNGENYTMSDLKETLDEVRREGCYVSAKPTVLDTRGVAAPVFTGQGDVFGSVGITMPSHGFGLKDRPRMSRAVLEAADDIRLALTAKKAALLQQGPPQIPK